VIVARCKRPARSVVNRRSVTRAFQAGVAPKSDAAADVGTGMPPPLLRSYWSSSILRLLLRRRPSDVQRPALALALLAATAGVVAVMVDAI